MERPDETRLSRVVEARLIRGTFRTATLSALFAAAVAPAVPGVAQQRAAEPVETWTTAVTVIGPAQEAARAARVQRAQLLDWLEQVRVQNDLPGLSLAVARDGEIVFSGGVGVAELENRTPQTGRTVHNVGSVSKVFAVVALMKLVEEGRVDLDAPIQTYLPYYPEKEHPISLRQILTHTSGTRHYRQGEFGEHDLLRAHHFESFEEATRLWRDDPLLYEPGTYWLYSSHAMNLMHGVVESVSGTGFYEYMRRHVFDPAGMLASGFDVPAEITHNRGHGYDRDGRGRFVHPFPEDPSYKYAGGGMLASAEDLARFGQAIIEGRLLRPETVRRMWEPQLDASVRRFVRNGEAQPLDHEQALAWWIRADAAGRRYPSHTGTVKGTRAFVGVWPEHGLSVGMLANALPFDSAGYGEAVAQMFLPPAAAAAGGR